MTPHAVTRYLHEHIPLTLAIGARVVALDQDTAVLAAPLAPNLNHRNTAFGGSLATLGILSSWTLLHFALRGAELEARLVIQRSACDYLEPVAGEFVSHSTLAAADREKFVRTLRRYRRARISIDSRILCGDALCVTATGTFVALL